VEKKFEKTKRSWHTALASVNFVHEIKMSKRFRETEKVPDFNFVSAAKKV
jgi:hypothetical protein